MLFEKILKKKLVEEYSSRTGNKSIRNEQRQLNAIKLLTEIENGEKKETAHFHFEKNYELLKIGADVRVIQKRWDNSKAIKM